jgi:potassium/hydrogen antiporter
VAVPLLGARDLVHRLGRAARRGAHRAGAVPAAGGHAAGRLLFNVAFVVVLVSLLCRARRSAWAARKLGVALPDPVDEQAVRAVFRDFELDPATPVGAVCSFYGLPLPAAAALSVAEWMAAELGAPPVAGDTVRLGPAVFVVRELRDGRICRVGLGLQE